MFSYESQREGSTFGHGNATRGFQFGALYCGAARSGPKEPGRSPRSTPRTAARAGVGPAGRRAGRLPKASLGGRSREPSAQTP